MRVLYVAPRFHTNQVPIVRGWLHNGHQVMFISQFAGKNEDYTELQPVVMGYSALFNAFMYLYRWLIRRGHLTEKQEFNFRIKAGFPPLFKMIHFMREFQPDLVILRERSLYNIPAYLFCQKKHIRSLLYNQSPLWDGENKENHFSHRLLRVMLPKQRITPVWGNRKVTGAMRAKDSFFVPFVAEPFLERTENSYCREEMVHFICIGRYEERKRLFMLVDAVMDFLRQGRMKLEIAGEAADEEQKVYYAKLQTYIREQEVEHCVKLNANLSREQVFALYCSADVFVLPSTKERASIAQLEAMSCSIPVICSDTNGSACYVKNGVNGYLFRDDDVNDLKEKIACLLENRKLIFQMGRAGYLMVKEQYSFENYYEAIQAIGD